jgi:hypothetical protein
VCVHMMTCVHMHETSQMSSTCTCIRANSYLSCGSVFINIYVCIVCVHVHICTHIRVNHN